MPGRRRIRGPKRSWTLRALLSGAAAMSLVLVAACSSSSSSGSTSSTGSSSSGSAASGTGSAASGTPVKFVEFGLTGIGIGTPELLNAQISAVEKIINGAGGIKGRPISISLCQSSSNQGQASQCALSATQDSGVVGVLNADTQFGASVMPILQQAGMASVGTQLQTPADYQSPISFPFSGGGPGNVGGDAALCLEVLKQKNVGLSYVDIPAGAAVAQIAMTNILQPANAQVTQVSIPVNAADVSAQVQKLSGTGCVVSANAESVSFELYNGLQSLGYKGGLVAATVNTADIAKSITNGTQFYWVNAFDYSSQGYTSYVKSMTNAGADQATINDPNGFNLYLGAEIAAHVLNNASEISRSALLDGMQKLNNYDTQGATAKPLDFTQKLPAPYNRVFNPYEFGVQYISGQLKVVHPAVNAFGTSNT